MFQTINRLANMAGPFEVRRREFRRGFDGNGDVRRVDSENYPPISVRQDDQHVLLQLDVPGLHSEDLNLTLSSGFLRIRGRRNRPQRTATCRFDDRPYGEFERIVRLDQAIDPDSIDAKLEDGVLSVRLSKLPQAPPHRVEVKYGGGAN